MDGPPQSRGGGGSQERTDNARGSVPAIPTLRGGVRHLATRVRGARPGRIARHPPAAVPQPAIRPPDPAAPMRKTSSRPHGHAIEQKRHRAHNRRVPKKIGKHGQHDADGPPPSKFTDEPEQDFEVGGENLGYLEMFDSAIEREAKAFAPH